MALLSNPSDAFARSYKVGRTLLSVPEAYHDAILPLESTRGMTFKLEHQSFLPYTKMPPASRESLEQPSSFPETVVMMGIETAHSLAPDERLKTLYPRYLESERRALPENMQRVSFKKGSPYSGEDLVTDTTMSGALVVLCPSLESSTATSSTSLILPRTCIASFRYGGVLDITVRFHESRLPEARDFISKARRLITAWTEVP